MAQIATFSSEAMVNRVAAVRVQAIDVVRGLVMVIMALDHVREFWSTSTVRPEDIAHTSAALFFTRWITHFCAPTFVFLSGASIFLYQQKQRSRWQVSKFLLTRGLWLVVLEILVITILLTWSYEMLLLQVIWAIGWSMVVLAGLVWLPRPVSAVVAIALIAGHNLLPNIQPVTTTNWLWALLHNAPGLITLPPLPPMLSAYTLVPWVAVMLAGYVIGPWFLAPLPQRTQWLRRTGALLLLLFVALRATNWYGDPSPWQVQPRGWLYTVLSFLNVTKYPASLLFLCLTLGVALLLLSWLERPTNQLTSWLRTFGQVPFFYFLLHLALISGSAWLWTQLAFGRAINLGFASSSSLPPAYQPNLLRAYVVWLAVVLVSYLPCRWYQRYKRQHNYWWLSYL